MTKCEELGFTAISGKGQVVIPAAIRAELDLKPKTKLLVYRFEDSIILKKLILPDFKKEVAAMYDRTNSRIANGSTLTSEEIDKIIHQRRNKKAKVKPAR